MRQKAKRRTKIVAIVLGAIVVVAVLIITVAGGAFMPRNYLDPWEKDYHQRFDDPRMQVAAHGLPGGQQPQHAALADRARRGGYHVLSAPHRWRETDPSGRSRCSADHHQPGDVSGIRRGGGRELGYACDIELFPQASTISTGRLRAWRRSPWPR